MTMPSARDRFEAVHCAARVPVCRQESFWSGVRRDGNGWSGSIELPMPRHARRSIDGVRPLGEVALRGKAARRLLPLVHVSSVRATKESRDAETLAERLVQTLVRLRCPSVYGIVGDA